MTIDTLKKFKWLSLIIWASIGFVLVLVAIIGLSNGNYYLSILLGLGIVCLAISVAFLTINYKQYEVNGYKVLCYAGFEKHLLIINGELVDEFVSAITFTPIELKYKDEFHEFYVRISLSNSITLKVDGKLVK